MAFLDGVKKLTKSKNKFINVMSNKVYRFVQNSNLVYIIRYRILMNDENYVKYSYKKRTGYELNLHNPVNFNEKNNWRKLYDRQEIYTELQDKYKCKTIVDKMVGGGHTIPLLGVWDDPRQIDFDSLPDQFVLKPNHAGGIIICRDKVTFNRKDAIRELRHALKTDFSLRLREWQYKNIRRRVICEKFMGDGLVDYKNYCFGGKVVYTLVWKNIALEDGRKPIAYFCGMFDRAWHKTDMELDYPSKMDEVCEKPDCYDEMIGICEKMSAGIPFVRADCYIIDNNVYIGEMTILPWGGVQKFKDEKWNKKLGEMMVLPDKVPKK